MFDLHRFRQAQDGRPGLSQALAELRAGAKTSHWIWYVFPQLRGLGRSSMAVRYGLDGLAEATAYLRDPALSKSLALAVEAVANQIASGVPLDVLMGSDIDVTKLVSSMTLFGPLAQAERDPPPEVATIARRAPQILRAAAAAGHPPCAFTEERLRVVSAAREAEGPTTS